MVLVQIMAHHMLIKQMNVGSYPCVCAQIKAAYVTGSNHGIKVARADANGNARMVYCEARSIM